MSRCGLSFVLLACVTMFSFSVNAMELRFNTQDFPPYSYLADGMVSGPGVEIITRVCTEMKLNCSFKLLVWTRAQKEVEEGMAQGMFFIGKNPEREKWLYFSPPIIQATYGFFVNMDNALKYSKPVDISGYSVGVYGPSNTSVSLEKIRDQMSKKGAKPINIDMRPNDEAGFHKLSANRVQAVYSNHDVGIAKIAKIGLKNIRYAGSHERVTYYVGFSQKYVDKSTVDQFNTVLLRLQKSGEIGKILARYQMKDMPHK